MYDLLALAGQVYNKPSFLKVKCVITTSPNGIPNNLLQVKINSKYYMAFNLYVPG